MGSYGTRSWTYDANGNRTSETANSVVSAYAYPLTNNRLTNVKQGTVTTRAFTHDAAGNVIQDLRGANAYNYAVNNAGRIKWVTGAGTASYLYDGFQKLRYKSQGGAVTNYAWDSFGHIIAETSGSLTREYIWLGDTPLAVYEGATLSYVHPDHLDRPVAMTTSGGPAIAWQAKYDPFGNVVTITNPTAMTARFPGQWFQIEDGLSYNWHRNYDPTLGRYSQADPLGFVDGPGVYNYAGGSPVMNVDRDGRQLQQIVKDGVLMWGGVGIILCAANQSCREFFAPICPPLMSEPHAIPCDEQWDFAYQVCEDQIANGKREPYNTGGHTDIHKCAKGLVSQACGGNKVH